MEDENDPDSSNDFGKNIIPKMLAAGEKMLAYRFEGYWKDVGTLESLWDANMDMLSRGELDLLESSWPIYSRIPSAPPAFMGKTAKVEHSVMTQGCDVNGSVFNSVLSDNVVVEEGADVQYSVLMPGVTVKRGAVVKYAILGENVPDRRRRHGGRRPHGLRPQRVGHLGHRPGRRHRRRGDRGPQDHAQPLTMRRCADERPARTDLLPMKRYPALRELTEHRSPASVPFGGRYRIIDFMLSNLVNAGVFDVGVILHGNYQSLLDHLGTGKDWDLSRIHGGLRLLPPFATVQSGMTARSGARWRPCTVCAPIWRTSARTTW